jgi:hypothetical protein
MAVDVIIDPSSGQIYWNDQAGSGTQTIAISGNATNAINVVGYSNFFSPGGGGLGTQILATFNDSATSTFTPGTNAYDLGSTSLRWNFYGTGGNFTGAISTSSTTASTSSTTGALVVSGGAGIAKTSYFAQDVKIQGSTASTTPNTGALTVTGGVGISGSLKVGSSFDYESVLGFTPFAGFAGSNPSGDYVGIAILNEASYGNVLIAMRHNNGRLSYIDFGSNGDTTFYSYRNIYFTSDNNNNQVIIGSSAASTNTTTGALRVYGGAGIAKTSYFGQSVFIQGTTASGSTTTGALVVTGGVGIGGSLNVFGTIDVANNIKVLSQKEVRFFNSANTFYTGLRAGSSSANVTFTLPIADGTANQVLYTNGSAALGWTTIASVSAITTLNGLTAATQTFATGTSGTDFNISSATSTHTFNIPYAGAASTGLITTQAQTIAGAKTFSGNTAITASTASTTPTTGALVVTGGVGIGGSLWTNTTTVSSISGVQFLSSRAQNGFTINASSSYTFNIQDGANNQRLNYHGDSNRTEFTGNNATHEIRLIHSNNSSYTGFKANSSGTVTYTLPAGDGSNGQVLYTNGSAGLAWTTPGSSGGGTSGVVAGGQYQIAYYTATGSSVSGSSTFLNDTAAAKVSITHTTASTSTTTGALVVSGGVGIAKTSYFGQDVIIQGTTSSTTTATGALLVFGGLGVTGQINAASLQTTGNAVISGNLTFNGVGVFGNATSDTITSLARYASDLLPSADNSYDLGNNALGWRNFKVSGVGTIATLAVTSSTSSTSSTTGALVVTGGAGIAKTSYFGQDVKILGSTASTNPTTGALVVNGGVGISGRLSVGLAVTQTVDGGGGAEVIATFASSASFTGAAVVIHTTNSFGTPVLVFKDYSGKEAYIKYWDDSAITPNHLEITSPGALFYNAGNSGSGYTGFHIFSGSGVTLNHDTASTSSTTGGLTVSGGAGIAKTSYFGQSVVIQGTTAAGSTTTGALVVTGGVGIGGSLNVFGTIDVANNIEVLSQKEVRFFNSANTFYTGLRAGSSSANVTFTLPIADGSANQVLYTNGSAALGWTSNISGTASIATSSINSATTTDTSSTLYLLGSRSSTGFAGTAIYVDSSISILGSRVTAGVWAGTAISAVNGGTGQNTYAIGDILYASSSTALTRLAAGTAGSVLASGGAGAAPSWVLASAGGGGGSGTVTSGTAGSIAYYTDTGTTVGGSPGFTYTTSGTASTINVFGGGAIGTTIFTVQATSSTSVRVGIGTNLPQYELEIVGELSATNKSFVIDHPTKPGKKLRYGSLEGPENGVYVRGELKGSNIIETPDHWIGLVYPDSFTVTLTPISRFSHLYVEKIEDYKVFIADDCMNPIHCYYTVWAERKDIPKLITEY